MATTNQNPPQASNQNQLGQYTILEKIAQGGMAQVFKAKTVDAQGIERLVVIKRILPHISSNSEYVEMLVNEAKVAVNFTHGNIAQIYDLGRVNDDYFIVMEYVDGKTLSQINKALIDRKRKFPLDILLYCFIEVCRGLSYIHRKTDAEGKSLGVVHRDVSPQNVILSYSGSIKIIDFGVAKAEREEKTESGVLKGKFAYMSPEQSKGEDIDYRSDLFSVGILLWELATGERLFKRKTNQDTIKAVQKAKFDAPSTLNKMLPREFDAVIKRALQRKPKDRYADAAEIADELEKLLRKQFPEFKPIQAVQFLYELFGPEKDETALPLPSFVKSVPAPVILPDRPEPVAEDVEEPTLKENPEAVTPIVRIQRKMPSFGWLKTAGIILGILAIFGFGSYYAWYVYRENQKAFVSFKNLDDDSRLFIDGKLVDPVPDRLIVKSNERHSVRVIRKDFHDYVAEVTLKPRESYVIQVQQERLIPPFGDLTIETTPSGATVFLDDMEWRQKTPVRINHLRTEKKYKITLQLENYKTESRDIEVIGGKEVRIEQPLQIDYASLMITSTPSGATVLFDDQEVGKTPYESHFVTPNESFRLSVLKQGFADENLDLTLGPAESKTLDYQLKPGASTLVDVEVLPDASDDAEAEKSPKTGVPPYGSKTKNQ